MSTNKFVKNSGPEIESLNDELYQDLSIEELERRLEMGCYPINICGVDCGSNCTGNCPENCVGNCPGNCTGNCTSLCGANCAANCQADICPGNNPNCRTYAIP